MDTETLAIIVSAIVACLTASGGVFAWITSLINKRIDRQTNMTEAQTRQNANIGKLRDAEERLERKNVSRHQDFLVTFARAYARGNDRDKIADMTDIIENDRSDVDDLKDELADMRTAVYDGKAAEAEVNQLVERINRLKIKEKGR